MEVDRVLKVYRAGQDAYFIRGYEGHLTGSEAKALVETRFDVKLDLDEYQCTIDTYRNGRDKQSNATFLRKRSS